MNYRPSNPQMGMLYKAIADLGHALLIVPAGQRGRRGLLERAIEEAGGYANLAKATPSDDSDLALGISPWSSTITFCCASWSRTSRASYAPVVVVSSPLGFGTTVYVDPSVTAP